jgi:hypothetical protein
MKLLDQLNVIDNTQRIIIEMNEQSILGVNIGNFVSLANKFDKRLAPYYDIDILSIGVGPNDTLLIRI